MRKELGETSLRKVKRQERKAGKRYREPKAERSGDDDGALM